MSARIALSLLLASTSLQAQVVDLLEPLEARSAVVARYAGPARASSRSVASSSCVGLPPVARGCWTCDRGGSVSCGPTAPSGRTAATRFGRPARCSMGGASAPTYELGPCCEREYQTAQALALAWCIASRSQGAVNPGGLAREGCDGVASVVERLDLAHSVRDGTGLYALVSGVAARATVTARQVEIAVTRPPYTSTPASVEWGDGETGSAVDRVSHTYAAAGSYRITVRAADACGVVREVVATVQVSGDGPPPPPPPPPDPDPAACPSPAELAAWLDGVCARPDRPWPLEAACLSRAAVPDTTEAELFCELRRWVRGLEGAP